MSEKATSFGALADLYDRVRPGYPLGAIDAVLVNRPERVADVGAGTGKLTAALDERVATVIAVEPDPAMRAVLTTRCPNVSVRAGSAEALPLGDGEVDAITFGQSWHWVDAGLAVPQARRSLRPGGTLNMLWNRPDANGNPPGLPGFGYRRI